MNEILKIIEERELYSHLILTKIYISTKGKTNESYHGNLLTDLKQLFGTDFNNEIFSVSKQFLYSENLVSTPSATKLTENGRKYFEDFIKNYQTINAEEIQILNTELPVKVSQYLGLGANIVTIVDFFTRLTKL